MDKSARFLRYAFYLIASRFLNRFRAPIGTHICKNLRPVGQKLHKHHSQAVEDVIFRREYIRLSRSVPVKGGIQHRFREITVGIEIRPLTLSLEACRNRIMAYHFLFTANGQVLVAVHQIFDDTHHLNNELPVLVLLLSGFLNLFRIFIKAFNAVCFCPGQRLFKFCLVINAFRHTADDFHLIHGFHTHSQILFNKCGINDGTADAHADRTNLQIRFSSHSGNRYRSSSEAKQLLHNILRDIRCVRILNIMSVNTECRKSLLRMGSQYTCQIYGSGTLRTVKAPYALDRIGIHIHCFRAIAPAGCYGQGNIHTGLAEFVRACRSLAHTTDGSICNNHLYRLPVGVA